ncbi:MAG: large conductance mechanosensitive channel protein MscL [Chloroflexi bacterium]|nr:large conductance mechanosensitive channel protein MscL [Chloroflexota bacterium]
MFKEFREFVMRGNVLDLAVGVIIGGAFGKIVGSLVNDILMPLIGLLMGGVDFSSLSVSVGAAELKWGLFVQTIVDFLIIAFVIFLIVRSANSLKKAPPPRRTRHQGMSALLQHDPHPSHALPELHVGTKTGKGGKEIILFFD